MCGKDTDGEGVEVRERDVGAGLVGQGSRQGSVEGWAEDEEGGCCPEKRGGVFVDVMEEKDGVRAGRIVRVAFLLPLLLPLCGRLV